MKYAPLIREHPDKNRCDISPLLADAVAFNQLIRDLAAPFRDRPVTKVVALDALGFILAGAVATHLNVGVALLRKPGKVAWHADSESFTDYNHQQNHFELVTDSLNNHDAVLIVDDWAETGGQLRAAIDLIERHHAQILGIAMIHIEPTVRADPAFAKYHLHAAIDY